MNNIKNIIILSLSLVIIFMGGYFLNTVSSLKEEINSFNKVKEQVIKNLEKISEIDRENFFLECRNDNLDLIYDKSCNEYIDSLDAQCEDSGKLGSIFDDKTKACISKADYKIPLIACSISNDFCSQHVRYPGYSPYEYSSYEELVELEGNEDSNTIVIFSQGGPSAHLEKYMNFLYKDYLVAYTYQVNILKKFLLNSYNASLNEMRLETEENTKMLHEVYLGLRKKYPNKKFVLMGHSMGSFQVLDYLAAYGNPFSKVVHLGGRFKFEYEFIKYFFKNQEARYTDFLPKPKLEEKFPESPEYYIDSKFQKSKIGISFYTSLTDNLILASLGQNNYLELLENVDLTNLLSYSSSEDEQLGDYSKEEVDFLKDKGATHYYVQEKNENIGGHSMMIIGEEAQKKIIDFIEN